MVVEFQVHLGLVGNGGICVSVKQGRIVFHVLFNLYVDLSKSPDACQTWCMVGDAWMKHLKVVFSPRSIGLSSSLISEYGMENDINTMPVNVRCQHFPVFQLSDNALCTKKKVLYLGHLLLAMLQ